MHVCTLHNGTDRTACTVHLYSIPYGSATQIWIQLKFTKCVHLCVFNDQDLYRHVYACATCIIWWSCEPPCNHGNQNNRPLLHHNTCKTPQQAREPSTTVTASTTPNLHHCSCLSRLPLIFHCQWMHMCAQDLLDFETSRSKFLHTWKKLYHDSCTSAKRSQCWLGQFWAALRRKRLGGKYRRAVLSDERGKWTPN